MTRFIFVRHGESETNLSGVFTGQIDAALTEKGRRQAEAARDMLLNTHIDAAYSSDLSRAYETGSIIAVPHGLTVERVPALRELDAGVWQGRTFESLSEQDDYIAWRRDRANIRCTGGESYIDLWERVRAACEQIAERDAGKTVLVAAHAGPIRVMQLTGRGLNVQDVNQAEPVPNASVLTMDYADGRWTIVPDARLQTEGA